MKTRLGLALGACLLTNCAGDDVYGDATGDASMRDDVIKYAREDVAVDREDVTVDREDVTRARDVPVEPDVPRSRDATPQEDAPRDRVDVAEAPDALDAASDLDGADSRDSALASDDAGADAVTEVSVTDAGFTDVFVTDTVRPDAPAADAPAHDGGPADCTRGVELPVIFADATARGLSLATSGDRHAVTWVTTRPWTIPEPRTATWLVVLDADGNALRAPRSVANDATVVSLTEGFGLITPGALTPLDRDGLERGPSVTLGASARWLMRVGDRLYWTVTASDGGAERRVASLSASATGTVEETPLMIPAGLVPIAYGPSRVLAATNELTLTNPQRLVEVALDGATARVRFDQRRADGPTYVQGASWDAGTNAWIVAGVRHLPMSRECLAHAWSVSEGGVLTPLGSGLRPSGISLYYWPTGSLTRGARGDFLALYANASGGGPVAHVRGDVLGGWAASGAFGSNYHSALPATWSDLLGRYTVLYGVNGDSSRGPETRLAVRCLR